MSLMGRDDEFADGGTGRSTFAARGLPASPAGPSLNDRFQSAADDSAERPSTSGFGARRPSPAEHDRQHPVFRECSAARAVRPQRSRCGDAHAAPNSNRSTSRRGGFRPDGPTRMEGRKPHAMSGVGRLAQVWDSYASRTRCYPTRRITRRRSTRTGTAPSTEARPGLPLRPS